VIGESCAPKELSSDSNCYSTFHNLLFKDLKTKIKIRTNNLLHVKFTFYGMFKLETKKLPYWNYIYMHVFFNET